MLDLQVRIQEGCTYPTKKGFLQPVLREILGERSCTYPTKKGLLQHYREEYEVYVRLPTKKGLLQPPLFTVASNLTLHLPHEEGASTTSVCVRYWKMLVALTPRRRGFYNATCFLRSIPSKLHLPHEEGASTTGYHAKIYPRSSVALTPRRRGFYNRNRWMPRNNGSCTYPTKKGLLQLQAHLSLKFTVSNISKTVTSSRWKHFLIFVPQNLT